MIRSFFGGFYYVISFVTAGKDFDFAAVSPGEFFTTRSVDRCYGKQISAVCDPGQLLHVVTAIYRRTPDCSSSSYFEADKNCLRESLDDAPCTGNVTCHFLTPWIYLSSQCGYSNNFLIKYQCIPEQHCTTICSRVRLTDRRGFLTSPGYPRQYSPSTECALTVMALPGGRIQIRLIDIRLTHYRNANSGNVECADRLWVTDGFNQSEYFCTGQKREPVFTSSANQLTIHFTSRRQVSKTAKGFWLHYETIADKNVQLQTISPSVQVLLTTSPVQGDSVHLLSPPTSLEENHLRAQISREIGMSTSGEESRDVFPLAVAYRRGSIVSDRNSQKVAVDGEEIDGLPGIFPHSLIQLQNAEIHPDLVVETIPLRGNLRVESRIASWTTVATSPVVVQELRHQRPEQHPLKIGVVEIGVMVGAGSCAIIIVVTVVVGLFVYLRKRRKMAYGEKIAPKTNYHNMIFAFGNEDTPCSIPEVGFSNQTFGCSSSATPYSWSWNGRNDTNSRNGLLPIDEKMEDLYAEVKQCGLKADPARIQANAEAIRARSRSKSVDYMLRKKLRPGCDRNTKLALPYGSSHIQSLNIELLGCQTRSPWSCRSLDVGAVTFRRGMPSCDVYGRLGEEFGKGQLTANPRGMRWASARWERPGSIAIPTICAHDPKLFYIQCSPVPKLTASPIVDTPYEANLLEHEDVSL